MSEKVIPTRGQLERTLSQRIQSLYREQLGHQPSKVTVAITDERITILIEDAITQPEQLLVNLGREELTEQVRSDLDQAIQVSLRSLIEEVVGLEVVDLLSDTTLETGRAGSIAVLSDIPKFRNPGVKSSVKKKTSA
ncbi:MAG TPA: hypothetical protein DCY91_05395 [Cyanobacteria bacterium UBA11370]|nr:hypothetical protein [Cyanobacteria bacterium UBA11370]